MKAEMWREMANTEKDARKKRILLESAAKLEKAVAVDRISEEGSGRV